jgi:hypothetical protein
MKVDAGEVAFLSAWIAIVVALLTAISVGVGMPPFLVILVAICGLFGSIVLIVDAVRKL